MSIQNALKVIHQIRGKENENLKTIRTIRELADMSVQENLPCSVEELKKAFQIDWDMRWLKYSRQ